MPPWKTMNSRDTLSAADLWSERDNRYIEIDATIAQAKKVEVQSGDSNAKKTRVGVLYAANPKLPAKWHPLPSTCAQVIESIAGSEMTEKWPGVTVTLYVERVRVHGKMHQAIRLRPAQPAARGNAPSVDEQREIAEQERRARG